MPLQVGLIQVDGKLPNLALMQIASYMKQQRIPVGWYDRDKPSEFAVTFASQIFSFSKFDPPPRCYIGGTGIDFKNKLQPEIAACNPGNAWFLYPDFTAHLGFSMKGCRFNCDFCCVPQKEGRPWANSSIDDLLTNPSGGDRLILLDNDFFGGPNWKDNLLEIQDRKLKVSFCQGLNIRIITDEQAEMLAKTRFWNSSFKTRQVTFAWDRFDDEKWIKAGIDRCLRAGLKPYQMRFFVLVGFDTTEEQDLYRIEFLRNVRIPGYKKGCDPFVMPYDKSDPYQNKLARWVNHVALFKSVAWKDYKGPMSKARLNRLKNEV